MKNNTILKSAWIPAFIALLVSGCTKLLDKQPVTQLVTKTDSSSISATDAENLILGVYTEYKGCTGSLCQWRCNCR
jgi:hypothetical protein